MLKHIANAPCCHHAVGDALHLLKVYDARP
jgi:hypothetical protein